MLTSLVRGGAVHACREWRERHHREVQQLKRSASKAEWTIRKLEREAERFKAVLRRREEEKAALQRQNREVKRVWVGARDCAGMGIGCRGWGWGWGFGNELTQCGSRAIPQVALMNANAARSDRSASSAPGAHSSASSASACSDGTTGVSMTSIASQSNKAVAPRAGLQVPNPKSKTLDPKVEAELEAPNAKAEGENRKLAKVRLEGRRL